MLKLAGERIYSGANVCRPWPGLLLEFEGEVPAAAVVQSMLAAAESVLAPHRVEPRASEVMDSGPGRLSLFLPCDDLETATAGRDAVLAIVNADGGSAAQTAIAQAAVRAARVALDAATLAILREAVRHDIPWSRIEPGLPFVQLGQGARAQRLREAQTSTAGLAANLLALRRQAAAQLLHRHGLPARQLEFCASLAAASEAASRLGYPVWVARESGSAQPVSTIARGAEELAAAFQAVAGPLRGALLAPWAEGSVHRVLVMQGRVAAALPTASVHASKERLAVSAARILGLPIAGVELRTTDIAASQDEVPCVIEDIDPTPDLAAFMNANPQAGIATEFLAWLIPEGTPTRVPTAAVTGSVGKTTTCTLVAAILAGAGLRVARSTTQGAWIGGDLVATGDVAGGRTARRLMLDPSVEAGVFEMARGGLLRRGFTLDGVDVGAVLNVLDQHVGFEGVETREELARVKSLVARQAREAVVLNADDPLCMAMRADVKAPVLGLVSLQPANAVFAAHRAEGGLSAWHEDDVLHLHAQGRAIGTLRVDDVPTAWHGRFRPGLWHALFAMSIAHALGVPFERIAATLTSFQSTARTNPGRMNFYDGLPYQLIVAHASGPEGMTELMNFAAGMTVQGRKTLVFALAGNRTDEYIHRVGREAAAGGFDRYICTDWYELRGRPPREVATLLGEGLRQGGVPEERIVLADSLEDGAKLAYTTMQAGDLLIENTFTDASKPGWAKFRGLE